MVWIVMGGFALHRHSVVDRGAAGLLDITPLPDRETTLFLPDSRDPDVFDALPNQVILLNDQGPVTPDVSNVHGIREDMDEPADTPC